MTCETAGNAKWKGRKQSIPISYKFVLKVVITFQNQYTFICSKYFIYNTTMCWVLSAGYQAKSPSKVSWGGRTETHLFLWSLHCQSTKLFKLAQKTEKNDTVKFY